MLGVIQQNDTQHNNKNATFSITLLSMNDTMHYIMLNVSFYIVMLGVIQQNDTQHRNKNATFSITLLSMNGTMQYVMLNVSFFIVMLGVILKNAILLSVLCRKTIGQQVCRILA